MDSINNLYVIKVYELLSKSQLCLSSWLHKTLAWLASTCTIIPTICCLKLLSNIAILSSASDSTTPYDIKAIFINRNIDILGRPRIQHIIIYSWLINWLRINEEALVNGPCLNAFGSLKAVIITAALCIL